jgi:hypothetical protein
MWPVFLLAFAMALSGPGKPASAKADLVFLTREGCVHTPDMTRNLDAALQALRWPKDYQIIDIGSLGKTDTRRGYPTPTVLYKGQVFDMPKPTRPTPEPT